MRKQWKGSRTANRPQHTKAINAELLYQELSATDRDGALSQRVPLPELVGVLTEGTVLKRFPFIFNNL